MAFRPRNRSTLAEWSTATANWQINQLNFDPSLNSAPLGSTIIDAIDFIDLGAYQFTPHFTNGAVAPFRGRVLMCCDCRRAFLLFEFLFYIVNSTVYYCNLILLILTVVLLSWKKLRDINKWLPASLEDFRPGHLSGLTGGQWKTTGVWQRRHSVAHWVVICGSKIVWIVSFCCDKRGRVIG